MNRSSSFYHVTMLIFYNAIAIMLLCYNVTISSSNNFYHVIKWRYSLKVLTRCQSIFCCRHFSLLNTKGRWREHVSEFTKNSVKYMWDLKKSLCVGLKTKISSKFKTCNDDSSLRRRKLNDGTSEMEHFSKVGQINN